jgi:uncharacterized protein (DUF488 family)
MGDGNACYTIGHSDHSKERFMELLAECGVSVVLDIRSVPYSRRHPQYNRENIKGTLMAKGFGYEFLGDALGARGWGEDYLFSQDVKAGKVNFHKVRMSPRFNMGISRVKELIAKGERPALMCAEGEPFDCHRFVLVSFQLSREGVDVAHILRNGNLIDNDELEKRLLEVFYDPDLFAALPSHEDALKEAYENRNLAM